MYELKWNVIQKCHLFSKSLNNILDYHIKILRLITITQRRQPTLNVCFAVPGCVTKSYVPLDFMITTANYIESDDYRYKSWIKEWCSDVNIIFCVMCWPLWSFLFLQTSIRTQEKYLYHQFILLNSFMSRCLECKNWIDNCQ